MMMFFRLFLLYIFVLSGTQAMKFVIVHMGGLLGQVVPYTLENGEEWGGLARAKTAMDQIDAEEPNGVLKIGYGKLAGVTFFEDIFNTAPNKSAVELYKELGFTTTSIGISDLFKNITDFSVTSSQLKFPIVCSNVDIIGDESTTIQLRENIKKFHIFNTTDTDGNARKVGLLAIFTPGSCERTRCEAKNERLVIRETVKSLNEAKEAMLKSSDVDLIIVNVAFPSINDVKVFASSISGIGVILGGGDLHLSDEFSSAFEGTRGDATVRDIYPMSINDRDAKSLIFASVAGQARFIGKLTVAVKDRVPIASQTTGKVVNLCDTCFQGNSNFTTRIDAWKAVIEEVGAEVLAHIDKPLEMTEPRCRFTECLAPLFIIDAIQNHSRGSCEASVINVGGIRNGFKVGPLKRKDINDIIPFGGSISAVKMRGSEVRKMIRNGMSLVPKNNETRDYVHARQEKSGTGRFLAHAGIKIEFFPFHEDGYRVGKIYMRNGNISELLVSSKNYRVCVPNFIIEGHDGYSIQGYSLLNVVGNIREIIISAISKDFDVPEFGRIERITNDAIKQTCADTCENGRCENENCVCNDGFFGEFCNEAKKINVSLICGVVIPVVCVVLLCSIIGISHWRKTSERRAGNRRVILSNEDICDVEEAKNSCSAVALYKNERVRVFYLHPESLTQVDYTVLLDMLGMRHKNIINFLGVISDPCCMIVEFGSVGKLSDALVEGTLPRDTDLICSISRDILNGVLYLHSKGIGHGILMPASYILTSDFICKVSNFHLHGHILQPEPIDLLLWLAPEILNQIMPGLMEEEYINRTLADIFLSDSVNIIEADHYGYGISLFAILTYNAYPWGDDEHTMESTFLRESLRISIITEGKRPPSPDAPPEWKQGGHEFRLYDISKSLMSATHSSRPPLSYLREEIEEMVPNFSKILESMTEKYTTRLEEVVAERSKQLATEKAAAEKVLSGVGRLLSQIIPDEMLHRLNSSDINGVSDTFPEAAVCVIQVVGFRSMIKKDPIEAISSLNAVFQQLDEVALEYHINQMVADAGKYVCAIVSGSKHSNIEAMLKFALSAISRIEVDLPDGSSISSRGAVTCGSPLNVAIMGHRSLRYTLFGTPVKVCNDMLDASDVATDCVHVDGAVVKMFSSNQAMFSFKPHGNVFIVEMPTEYIPSSLPAHIQPLTKPALSGRDKLQVVKKYLSTKKSPTSSIQSPKDSRRASLTNFGKQKMSVVSNDSDAGTLNVMLSKQKKLGVSKAENVPLLRGYSSKTSLQSTDSLSDIRVLK